MAAALRAKSFARIFRRLQRSMALSPSQKEAIVRRQLALGVRVPVRRDRERGGGVSGLSSAATSVIDAGAVRRDGAATGAGAGGVSPPQRRKGSVHTGASAYSSSVATSVPAFHDVLSDPDYESVESEDSGPEDHREAPTGTIAMPSVWCDVLPPLVQSAVAPSLKDLGDEPVEFPAFAAALEKFLSSSKHSVGLYTLLKVCDWMNIGDDCDVGVDVGCHCYRHRRRRRLSCCSAVNTVAEVPQGQATARARAANAVGDDAGAAHQRGAAWHGGDAAHC